jgi:hypothetical protein
MKQVTEAFPGLSGVRRVFRGNEVQRQEVLAAGQEQFSAEVIGAVLAFDGALDPSAVLASMGMPRRKFNTLFASDRNLEADHSYTRDLARYAIGLVDKSKQLFNENDARAIADLPALPRSTFPLEDAVRAKLQGTLVANHERPQLAIASRMGLRAVQSEKAPYTPLVSQFNSEIGERAAAYITTVGEAYGRFPPPELADKIGAQCLSFVFEYAQANDPHVIDEAARGQASAIEADLHQVEASRAKIR